jgi:hypothetical protein
MAAITGTHTDTIPFVITLKSKSHRPINLISQLLILLFLAAFTFYFIGNAQRNYWLLLIPAMVVGLWIAGWINNGKPGYQMHFRTELMIGAMTCILLPMFPHSSWFGVGLGLMSILERWVKRPDELSFTEEQVVRNSFPRKKYEWFEIENVLIRDNLFTLDLRNNKLIQLPLDEPVSKELQDEFNAWCTRQLHFKKEV